MPIYVSQVKETTVLSLPTGLVAWPSGGTWAHDPQECESQLFQSSFRVLPAVNSLDLLTLECESSKEILQPPESSPTLRFTAEPGIPLPLILKLSEVFQVSRSMEEESP